MKEETRDNGPDALNECIAQLRIEIAALALDLKKVAKQRNNNVAADRELLEKTAGQSDGGNSNWGYWGHGLRNVANRGEALAEGLGNELERHPLIGSMAAFGLGFLFARLLFRRS